MPLLFCLKCKVCTPIEVDLFMVRCSTCNDILLVPQKKGIFYAYSPCRYNTIIKIPTIYSCTCHHAAFTIGKRVQNQKTEARSDEEIPPNTFNGIKVYAVDNHSLVLGRALQKHFLGPRTLDEEIAMAKQKCNKLLTKKYGIPEDEVEQHKSLDRNLIRAQQEIENLIKIAEEYKDSCIKSSTEEMTKKMKQL